MGEIVLPRGVMPVQMAVLGLELRDWIAVGSLPAVVEFLAAPGVELRDVAEAAYEFADLMLEVRTRRVGVGQ